MLHVYMYCGVCYLFVVDIPAYGGKSCTVIPLECCHVQNTTTTQKPFLYTLNSCQYINSLSIHVITFLHCSHGQTGSFALYSFFPKCAAHECVGISAFCKSPWKNRWCIYQILTTSPIRFEMITFVRPNYAWCLCLQFSSWFPIQENDHMYSHNFIIMQNH